MKLKKSLLAILCFLWSGFFCLFWQPSAEAYGGGLQDQKFPQVISSERFAELAESRVRDELKKTGETRRCEVRLMRSAPDMRLPAGSIICQVDLPKQLCYNGVMPVYVSVYVDGTFYRRGICYYQLHVYQPVLVAVHDLMLEKSIAAADVRVEEREVEGARGLYLSTPSELEGQVPGRIIRTGQIVAKDMLQNPIVLDVGSPVTILTSYRGIQVRAEGIAMQRGRVGKSIRVRNAKSSKILSGIVRDASTVEVMSED